MSHHDPHPPPPLLKDDPAAADAARQRINHKDSFLSVVAKKFRSSSTPNLPSEHNSPKPPYRPTRDSVAETVTQDTSPITLDNTVLLDEDLDSDRYEWAVLYENQRGMTVFSIPYYSSASLLPSDPSPFTLPNAPTDRRKQPPISLDKYPLPDGNWQWVSRCWMIDMRSDSGEVQHDGFEYNWSFRRHNWRAQVGSFNAGGWVRRRRWIRLMVRPAKPKKVDPDVMTTPTIASTRDSTYWRHRQSMASSLPSSSRTGLTSLSDQWSHMDPSEVWLSDHPDENWYRCRGVMKRFPTDGQKLELWRLWLGVYHPDLKDKFLTIDKGKRREKQWTEDTIPMPSEVTAAQLLSKETISIAPRDRLTAVLVKYYHPMLQLFVFPDSKAQLIKLLGKAELLSEVQADGLTPGSSDVDFWSHANALADRFHLGLEPVLSPTPVSPSAPGSSNKPTERKFLVLNSALT